MGNLTTIIVSVTALITAIGGLITTILNQKKNISENIPKKVKNQSNINTDIITKMEYLKEFITADRVQIYDFHNGEHYANGRSALKVSCTYEVTRAGVVPFQKELQAIPISCIPIFIDTLLNKKYMNIGDLEEIKDLMPSTYSLKKHQGIKSFYDIILTNKDKEPIGFLAVQFVNRTKDKFTIEENNEIVKLKGFIENNLEKLKENK